MYIRVCVLHVHLSLQACRVSCILCHFFSFCFSSWVYFGIDLSRNINTTEIYSFCWKLISDYIKLHLFLSDKKTWKAPFSTLMLQLYGLLCFLIPLTTSKCANFTARRIKRESGFTRSTCGQIGHNHAKRLIHKEESSMLLEKCCNPNPDCCASHMDGSIFKMWQQNYRDERFMQVPRCESDLSCPSRRNWWGICQ